MSVLQIQSAQIAITAVTLPVYTAWLCHGCTLCNTSCPVSCSPCLSFYLHFPFWSFCFLFQVFNFVNRIYQADVIQICRLCCWHGWSSFFLYWDVDHFFVCFFKRWTDKLSSSVLRVFMGPQKSNPIPPPPKREWRGGAPMQYDVAVYGTTKKKAIHPPSKRGKGGECNVIW